MTGQQRRGGVRSSVAEAIDHTGYARYWPAAVRVLETLTGVSTGLVP